MQKIGAAEVGGLGEERNEEIGEDMSDAMERRLYGHWTEYCAYGKNVRTG